jgi:hypothetical protein
MKPNFSFRKCEGYKDKQKLKFKKIVKTSNADTFQSPNILNFNKICQAVAGMWTET